MISFRRCLWAVQETDNRVQPELAWPGQQLSAVNMWMSQHLPVHRQFRVISLLAVLALFCWCPSRDLSVGNKGLNAALLQASFCLWIGKVHELLPLFNVLLMNIIFMKKLALATSKNTNPRAAVICKWGGASVLGPWPRLWQSLAEIHT